MAALLKASMLSMATRGMWALPWYLTGGKPAFSLILLMSLRKTWNIHLSICIFINYLSYNFIMHILLFICNN